jgi:hypothetical protein
MAHTQYYQSEISAKFRIRHGDLQAGAPVDQSAIEASPSSARTAFALTCGSAVLNCRFRFCGRSVRGAVQREGAKIWLTLTLTVKDQLMFGKNGSSHDGAHSARPKEPQNVVITWTSRITKSRMRNPTSQSREFQPNLEFAMDRADSQNRVRIPKRQ